jgi:competence protein ComEC
MSGSACDVTVTFLDVGQGDCTLVIDHQQGAAILIDCPPRADDLVVQELVSNNATLHTAIVTHSHLDHFGGVLDVIEATGCERFLYNHDTLIAQPASMSDGRNRRDSAVLSALRRILEFDDEQLGPAVAGVTGTVGRVAFLFLSPQHRDLTRAVAGRRANAASGIVLLEIGGVRVLVGGDADADTWRRLLRANLLSTVTAIRWPHHGGDLRSPPDHVTNELMAALTPHIVAVSVGAENSYGHPGDGLLEAIKRGSGTLMCTQATAKCTDRPQSCAGSIQLRIAGGVLVPEPTVAAHRSRVHLLSQPQCVM